MKQFLKITSLALMLMLFNGNRNTVSAQDYVSANISYQDFYNDLSPYGNWIDYPEYGYVWSFNGDPNFRPYSTNGHWEWSDEYDWIWVSDYSWGWAPFHYGRWFFDPAYGWLWEPGYDWSPAWVAWRSGGDYYGWAPLNPGIGIGFSLIDYAPPIDYWCFAPRNYITSPRIYDYCVSSRNNFSIFNRTTIINNYNFYGGLGRNVFVNGPGRREVEGYTHQQIRSVVFRESNRPGSTQFRNNEVTMYRPNVERNDNRRFSPNNFTRYNNQTPNNGVFRRNNNTDIRSNNLPVRENNHDNNTIVRRDNTNDWQNRNDRNVFDRNNNNQPNRNDQQSNRVDPFRRNDQQQPSRVDPFRRNDQQSNQNNNTRNNDRGNWNNRSNNQPQTERRQVEQPRQFERRDNNNSNRQPANNSNRSGGNSRGRRG